MLHALLGRVDWIAVALVVALLALMVAWNVVDRVRARQDRAARRAWDRRPRRWTIYGPNGRM